MSNKCNGESGEEFSLVSNDFDIDIDLENFSENDIEMDVNLTDAAGSIANTSASKGLPLPINILEAANKVTFELLPEKSRTLYEKTYSTFTEWGLSLIHISEPTRPY